MMAARPRDCITQGGDPPVAPHIEVEEFPVVDQYALQADAFATGINKNNALGIIEFFDRFITAIFEFQQIFH